jgi:hypothetical protein
LLPSVNVANVAKTATITKMVSIVPVGRQPVTVVNSAPVPAAARRSVPTIPDAPKAFGQPKTPRTLEALARADPSASPPEREGHEAQQSTDDTATRIGNPDLSLDELALAARDDDSQK